ncbi:penicillin-binding protein 2 [soil metagenome]
MTFSGGRWGGGAQVPDAQISKRIKVLAIFALILFALIFFRLWYLQVLSGDKYLAEAQNNRTREVTVQAPRGEIVDRDGKTLVGNRTALALQVHTDQLPGNRKRRDDVLSRVGNLVGLDKKKVDKDIREQTKAVPGSPVTLKRDIPFDLVYFIRENQERFPGISADRVYVRQYLQGNLGAHLFGYVREVSAEQLKEPQYDDLQPGDEVGQDGVELTYDHLLRGINGLSKLKVDASGQPTGEAVSEREPKPGNNLVMSIDSKLQATGESALASTGLPGAFVAMNAKDGEVLALGSGPTFDPSALSKPTLSKSVAQSIFGAPGDDGSTGAPAFDRAISAGYPTGSTFKPITALAALDQGVLGLNETINDTGVVKIGSQEFKNANDEVYGPVQLESALRVSSDVFFYTLGIRLDKLVERKDNPINAIQDWAEKLGLGSSTGIDLPGEVDGTVPSKQWRDDLYTKGLTDRPWTVGDSINLAVGQGDLQASPLQMAVAYAAIGNGGDVVTPHVGLRAEDPAGRTVQEIDPQPQRHVDINPQWRNTIMQGLHDAATEPGGTSYGVFGGFPIQVAGKTGTAETTYQGAPYDQSWYVALAPYDNPKIVVAFTVERGGFGADTAAPAVQQMLSTYFNVKPGQIDATGDAGAGND